MDDTRHPYVYRPERRPILPFLPAALTLGIFAFLAVWPRVIPGLPAAPRLVMLAALLAATLVWRAWRRPATSPRPRRSGDSPDPAMRSVRASAVSASPAWLQIVSAPDAGRLTRGVLEIAFTLIEHGERVLVVDGARRLRVHERLGGDGAPGLLECLAGELPVCEAIQGSVEERLCLLPRGNPMRSEAWPQLGRLLLEARTRFDRVVLALDFAVPAEAGPAFAGLSPAAWWCPDGAASILSSALAERIGIPLRNIELSMPLEALRASLGQATGPDPGPVVLKSVVDVDSGATPGAPEATAEAPPQIVDCDLQVRERLRFLVWMRGVQAEGQRELEPHH